MLDWLFGAKAKGGGHSRTGHDRQFMDFAWPSQDPERLAQEGFQANATAYAAIMVAARAAAGVPWVLYQRKRGAKRPVKFMSPATAQKAWTSGLAFARKSVELSEVEEHPALTLWERPNHTMSGPDYVEAYEIFMLITGMTFTEIVKVDRGQRIKELWMAQPQRMRVIPDPVERIAGYAFIDANGKPIPFAVDEMMYVKFMNPRDNLLGQSPLAAVARAIDTDNEAAKWNWNLLKNAALPPGGFVTEQVLDDTTFTRMQKEVRAMLSGAKNARRPLILDGGVDWRNFSYSPADLDWLNGRKLSKREMYGALMVDGGLLGDPDAKTYASAEQARKALYTERVLPDLDKLKAAINKDVMPAFGDGLFLDYDRDQIEALQEEQGQLMDRLERCTFISLNDKRRATGYEDTPGGDVILVSSSMVPLDLIGEGGPEKPVKPEPDPEVDEDEAVEKARRLIARMALLPADAPVAAPL